MNNKLSDLPRMKEIPYPRFATFYNRFMGQTPVRRMFDPLRRETAGQAHGIVLEIGAGGCQNFSFYEKGRVVRVEAVEPDEAMLASARRNLQDAPVPIRLERAPVEALPFPDAHFDSAVVTLVFCSVRNPERGLREIWRVLKPGGSLLLLEHVRAQGKIAACIQDALVPLTTRCMGNCHWNRDTGAMVLKPALWPHMSRRKEEDSSQCCSCTRCALKSERVTCLSLEKMKGASMTASYQGRGAQSPMISASTTLQILFRKPCACMPQGILRRSSVKYL